MCPKKVYYLLAFAFEKIKNVSDIEQFSIYCGHCSKMFQLGKTIFKHDKVKIVILSLQQL